MALGAGRKGLASELVDEFGHLKGEMPAGEYYTKSQADNKFETKTHAGNIYQKKTLELPLELLNGSQLTVESALHAVEETLGTLQFRNNDGTAQYKFTDSDEWIDFDSGSGGGLGILNFIGTGYLRIIDNKVSGFTSQSNYMIPCISDGSVLKLDFTRSFEIGLSFFISDSYSNRAMTLIGSEQGFYYCPSIEVASDKSAIWCGLSENGSGWSHTLEFTELVLGKSIPLNEEIFVKAVYDAQTKVYSVTVSFEDVSKTLTAQVVNAPFYSNSYNFELGGINRSSNHYANYVSFDLENTYLKSEGDIVWGNERR